MDGHSVSVAGLRPESGGDQDRYKETQQRGQRKGPGFECGLEAAGPASHGECGRETAGRRQG